MNFKEVLDTHLKAIMDKDLDTLLTTISEDNVTLILSNGALICDREEFVEFHKDWFSDNDWNLNYEILKVEESNEISFALLKVNYNDIDQNGNQYSMNYYLTLVFKNVKGVWGLVFDQNTSFKG